MTSTHCQGAARLAAFYAIIVEAILTIAAGCVLLADITAMPARIRDNRRAAFDVSLSARMREARQALFAASAGERLIDREKPEAEDIESYGKVLKGYWKRRLHAPT